MPQKLTRTQIREGLDTIPIETLLSSGEGKTAKITSKQREFARAIALGQSKANAYRVSHKAKPTKATINTEPYKLARDPRIAREVEAYRLALEAEKHRTPVQLKALLVQQLVQHSLDEDFPPAQRMKALQLIGNLFEVGAFLERKESTIVHKSSDIRTRLLERLGKASDVTAKQDDGLTLLQEIRGDGLANAPPDAPTGGVGAPAGGVHAHDLTHTVSDIQTLEKKEGGGVQKNPDIVLDFDKE
jgi:type III secretion system FlhB-like substrate exporter